MIEFATLNKVHPALRSELRISSKRIRRAQIDALTQIYSESTSKFLAVSPVGMTLAMSASARNCIIYQEIVITLDNYKV
jgi:hypothetical protein